ncbi:hypothetical protein [Paenibacillus sp. Z3-2]
MTQTAEITKEHILGMSPGRDLDALVGKYVIKETPEIKWYAVNKEENTICMDFNYKSEADEWLEFDNKHWLESEIKIVRREIYREYSKSISAAYMIVDRFNELDDNQLKHRFMRELIDLDRSGGFGRVHSSPADRCKASLLAVLDL